MGGVGGIVGVGKDKTNVYAIQESARARAEAKAKEEQERAQSAAGAGAGDKVGGGSDSYEGALSDAKGKKVKKGSTLTGEGEATFTPKAGKLGE